MLGYLIGISLNFTQIQEEAKSHTISIPKGISIGGELSVNRWRLWRSIENKTGRPFFNTMEYSNSFLSPWGKASSCVSIRYGNLTESEVGHVSAFTFEAGKPKAILSRKLFDAGAPVQELLRECPTLIDLLATQWSVKLRVSRVGSRRELEVLTKRQVWTLYNLDVFNAILTITKIHKLGNHEEHALTIDTEKDPVSGDKLSTMEFFRRYGLPVLSDE